MKQFRKTPRAHQIKGINDIPYDATPIDRFRINVDVERVFERTTSAGDPCYFLSCKDTEGTFFSVVCWEWQYSRFQGRVLEGKNLEIDVKVPKEGYEAYTMA